MWNLNNVKTSSQRKNGFGFLNGLREAIKKIHLKYEKVLTFV